MKKLLRPKDIFLLALSGVVDFFEDLHDAFGFPSYAYKQLYGWVPEKFKKHNFYATTARALKTGYIEKVIKEGEVYFHLTSQGKNRLKRDFPLLFLQRKKWDKKWRVVVFDIAEISRQKRDLLRKKLKELGFGMLQRSVWITPYDIAHDFREFVEAQGLGEFVYVMEVSHLLAGDPKSLVNKIWRLEELNKEYKKIYKEIKKLKQRGGGLYDRTKKRKPKSTQVLKRRYERRRKEIRNRHLQILLTDPCLPFELLPEGWLGEEVKREIKKI